MPYALTLYSASRLISPYVRDDRHFLYLNIDARKAASFFREMETRLSLIRTKGRGNVCFAVPYYKGSVFRDARTVQGHPIVSRLQLYLDLMGFPPAGPEEAQHLLSTWEKKGEKLA